MLVFGLGLMCILSKIRKKPILTKVWLVRSSFSQGLIIKAFNERERAILFCDELKSDLKKDAETWKYHTIINNYYVEVLFVE